MIWLQCSMLLFSSIFTEMRWSTLCCQEVCAGFFTICACNSEAEAHNKRMIKFFADGLLNGIVYKLCKNMGQFLEEKLIFDEPRIYF
jgi:hypothetical protein